MCDGLCVSETLVLEFLRSKCDFFCKYHVTEEKEVKKKNETRSFLDGTLQHDRLKLGPVKAKKLA